MNYIEYGKENREVIVLLHGGGLSWWNYREAAELLQTKYHVILPVLAGHAGSGRDFMSIEDSAAELIDLIDRKFDGKVLLIGGLSLGGQILLETLAKRNDICRYALIESALVKPSKLLAALLKPTMSCCYDLICQKWFAKLQFKALHIKAELFDDYFRDTCVITKSNMTAILQANSLYSAKDTLSDCRAKVQILVGEKENKTMRKSAEMIQKKLLESKLQVLTNLSHGEFSLNHPEDYVKKIIEMLY